MTVHSPSIRVIKTGKKRYQGFTLIELLVVLLIMSLLVGLALPRLTALYQSVQTTLERDDILNQLSGLNYLAFQKGLEFTLTTYPIEKPTAYSEKKPEDSKSTLQPPLELPVGWRVRTESSILFRANGFCSGGIVYLEHEEQVFRFQLEPPFCQIKK